MSWFSRKSKRGRKSASRIVKKRGSSAERIIFWSKRLGLVFGIFIFIGWLGSWFFMSGASTRLADWSHNKILAFTADKGYRVANIMVEGRDHTDVDTLKAIINIKKDDPLFLFEPDSARDMLEKLSWVKSAKVERRLPDTIYVKLEERTPMALWQRNQRLSLIDTEGEVLTDSGLEEFKNYIVLVGDDVPERAPEFLQLLSSEPKILSKVEAAKSVSGRRWDVTLKSGAVVKLPEEEVELALSRLSKMQDEENIMDKDIQVIDVRELARITVRTKPGAVREYKASFSTDGNPI